MPESILNAILTSIVVSALVSSSIGGLFLFFSERSKRISEEKRTKMEIASKLTELHDRKVIETIKMKVPKVFWRNQATSFKAYYDFLESIWDNKDAPKDFDSPIPVEK